MLIKCPECDLQISDKAVLCPHCGYPMKENTLKQRTISKKKYRKLPNGFGQITEIKGRFLRKPFRAMVTIGKTPEGKPICKLLKPESYFKTYSEAYQALLEYNKNPYDLDKSITVFELYEKWSKEYFTKLKSDSGRRTITTSWAYCSSVYKMRVKDLRARHIKACMEEGKANINGKVHTPTAGIKSRIKSMFNLMLDYALEYELVDKNYSRTFSLNDEIIDEMAKQYRGHITFTDDEMKILWKNITKVQYVDLIIIQCFSGWRPKELGLIKLENVDLENKNITGGLKTKAGTDRIVPIHSAIYPYVKKYYDEAKAAKSEYLFNCFDSQASSSSILTYDKYKKRFEKVIKSLNLNLEHRPHDPRKQFATMAKKYNVDEYAIKYIMGHSITDITEAVYTKREKVWLNEEIEKIKADV